MLQISKQRMERSPAMNWIFEAYSNVYSVATLQERAPTVHAATAKAGRSRIAALFGRKAA
jgi:hypothetical protein